MESARAAFLIKPADVDSEIATLLRGVTNAGKAAKPSLALRLADRAHRLAPTSLEIVRLYSSLLIRNGFPTEAAAIISELKDGVPDAQLAAVDVEASLALADLEAAAIKLESYLALFAVSPWSALAKVARRVVEQTGPTCAGWIGVTPEFNLIGDLRKASNCEPIALEATYPGEAPLLQQIDCSGGWSKEDGLSSIRAMHGLRIASAAWQQPAIGANVSIPESFGFTCSVATGSGGLRGSLRLSWLPPEVVPSVVAVSGKVTRDIWLEPDPDQLGAHMFEMKAGTFRRWRHSTVDLYVRLPDGRQEQFCGSPYPLAPVKPYEGAGVKAPKTIRAPRDSVIKIIIPVYGGREDAVRCIESVRATVPDDVDIVVIDDASPDSALTTYLREFADSGAIKLLSNLRNMGFPASVNRGMAEAAGYDIIILNSDTVVFPGWLERMRAHADANPEYATITPLSNVGSIASYPANEDPLCSHDRAELRDRHAAIANAGQLVEAPTGVGFCMFLRRAAIDQVGPFDEALFSLGYGEENDFCMRASSHGWKHGIACDIYVLHRGGISFGPRKHALMARNGAILNERHPSYSSSVEDFASRDPLAPFRRALGEAEVALQDKQCLVVSLGLRGGVERQVNARLNQLREDGYSPILIRPTVDGKQLQIDNAQTPAGELCYDLPRDAGAFESFLERCRIEHLEIHHYLGIPDAIIETCINHSPSFDIYIHDFSWYCPRLTLLGLSNLYCGEPDIDRCEQCVSLLGSALHEEISVANLRARSERWFSQARRLIVPSEDTAARYRNHFPRLLFEIQSWESEFEPIRVNSPSVDAPLKIAVIGAIGDQKGYDFLLECARYAALRDLPVEFIVFGFTQDDQRLMQTGKVFITGRYEEDEIGHLLQREAPAAAVFLSVTPETWCFSLSHAMRAGLPILAFDHGAVAERLKASKVEYELVDLGVTAQKLYRALVDLVGRHRDNLASGRTPNLHSELAREANAPSVFRPELPPGVERVPVNENISATAEFLKLAKGLYLFSVVSDNEEPSDEGNALPAVQISTAPGSRQGAVEYLGSRNVGQHWLYRSGDNLVLKVTQSSTDIVVTLVTRPNLKPLQIDVQRLEGEHDITGWHGAGSSQPASFTGNPQSQLAGANIVPPLPPTSADCLKSQIVVHVQNVGDMVFFDQSWAGASDRKLSIEAFAITPMLNIAPDGIEYKCLMATGMESHWVEQGQPCGTRGLATPLLGFAVRPKNGSRSKRFSCEYFGRFASGKVVGPIQDGQMCAGIGPSDYLESIWVRILERNSKRPKKASASGAAKTKTQETNDPPSERIGPRFSVFREIDA